MAPDRARRGAQLCHMLGTARPVLGAPMARVAGGELVTAVGGAGGLGFLGAGYGDPGWLDDQVASIPAGVRFGVGLITWHMQEGALDAVLATSPAAVWLSFGDPAPYIPAIHGAGALAVCQVGRCHEAVAAAAAGADVVVVQGSEAGGHGRAGRGLFGLLPEVADAVPDVPIVAAGAVVDRRGFDAALALGAWGVAVGTALYGTTEAIDTEEAKAHLVASTGDDTVQSRVYDHVRGPLWPNEYVERTVRTELTDRWAGREDELAQVLEPIRRQYAEDVAGSDMARRVLFAGEGVAGVREIVTAADVVARFPTMAD